jgi:hypothetical protein
MESFRGSGVFGGGGRKKKPNKLIGGHYLQTKESAGLAFGLSITY